MANDRKLVNSQLLIIMLYIAGFTDLCPAYMLDDTVDFSVSCPAVCTCNQAQLEVDCARRYLSKPPLHIASNTRSVSLAGNRNIHLSASYLTDLPSLTALNLSSNAIAHLSDDMFSSVLQLEVLDLSYNHFEQIPIKALSPLIVLRSLSLAGNRISSLSWDDDHTLDNLQYLDLSNNKITQTSMFFLDSLPSLIDLNLAGNRLTSVDIDSYASLSPPLFTLDISSNLIADLRVGMVTFSSLKILNISSNRLTSIKRTWFTAFPNLNFLNLDDNQIQRIASGDFTGASHLQQLSLCRLNDLTGIDEGSLRGLDSVVELSICNSSNLSRIHWGAFADHRHLEFLDLRNNDLHTISRRLLTSLKRGTNVRLSGNPWNCDCRLKMLRDALAVEDKTDMGHDIVCSRPWMYRNVPLFQVAFNDSMCNLTDDRGEQYGATAVSAVHLGHDIVLDCEPTRLVVESLTWSFGRGKIIEGRPLKLADSDTFTRQWTGASNAELSDVSFIVTANSVNESESDRFKLLSNGSLMIYGTTRHDTGYYYCTVSNRRGDFTSTVELRLDYTIMSGIMETSFFVGFLSAATFFSFAAILALVRYLAHVCSDEERAKRRSLRELLAQMRSSSHVDRFTAYRTAKMDQFAAFKSATMDQLSAFKTDRIGRLRKYKQATVSAVLHQLERMREHYAAQTARIKESYAENVDRLRENYALQRARFQDRRSVSVQHIRKQYRARAERAREYSMAQVVRLREQYKQQQQYFLKLLELIDVGSCVSQAVEVECMRAESAIFDAGAITFDEEARPSHATRGEESLLFETASLPDGFPVLNDSIAELSSVDIIIDDAIDDFLPPLDVHMRSLSTSNLGEGRILLSEDNVLFHRACDVEQEASNGWKKSESTPVMCVVEVTDEATGGDTVV